MFTYIIIVDLLDSWSGVTWLTMASLGFLVSLVLLAWSCWGKAAARPRLYTVHHKQ